MEINKTLNAGRISLKSVILLFLIMVMLGIFVLLQGKDSLFNLSKQPRIIEGRPAPDFTLPGLDGRTVSLIDYRGKVVLLNIWATWCPPCVEEMPSMQRLYKELRGGGFEILAVSIDSSGVKAVAPFMQKYKLSFTALLNPEGSIQSLYGTTGVPESFIINKKGIVEKIIIGPRDWSNPEIIRFISNLMKRPQ